MTIYAHDNPKLWTDAQDMANANGAPVMVLASRATRSLTISEDPETPLLNQGWQEWAIVEPGDAE
jgi:hypothetical protein